ncbi:MAG: Glutamyl-tRNA reductase [Candidatus Moanabacter tarae]|uniref:Glutamyl-tRNA reductase n=1 Tax=Candidatus Moanibacter tarae TaxID=2200854 RepID=A0A2Z4AIZ0_9BACT|nr:MAG: Glutamyl-tRNA reductase [Candidatus Moanabacter tarae]|tara:strand:- start:693 stop:1748 length:1056 start_codon:yes stop_codon:yes gene_type:complete
MTGASMSKKGSLNIYLCGSNHRSATLEIREKFSITGDRIKTFYDQLKNIGSLQENLFLNTCNRVELYSISPNPSASDLMEDLMSDFYSFDRQEFSHHNFKKKGAQAVRHLFEVSAGLDSQLIGETEIFGQVKESYQYAKKLSTVGPLLHRVVQKSFQASKWVRTHTSIGRGHVSIGNVAVDLASRIFGPIRTTNILLIGTGKVGRLTAKALRSHGASAVTVTGRTKKKAEDLAQEINGQSLPFSRLNSSLHEFDIIISSASVRKSLLGKRELAQAIRERPLKPLFLIDLGVPRNFEAETGTIENVYLYNLDDLTEIANQNLRARMIEVERCKKVLDERADSLSRSLGICLS